MKEEMRKYFVERFEDSNIQSLSSMFISAYTNIKRKIYCEQTVIQVLESSDELRLLVGAMRKYGCNFRLSRHVACENCNSCVGGFDPDTSQIVICQNNCSSRGQILNTLTHEMIHMFDYCRAKFDFDNLEHIACSEIRASNLTYCSVLDRLKDGKFDIKKSHEDCVKETAFKSVAAYAPDTDPAKVAEIVDKVFPVCYNDLEPFGRRPTLGREAMRQSYRERYHFGYD